MEEELIKLTDAQQDAILDKENNEERMETLRAIRDKIVQGIESNKERSGERAIWELMQNARDLSNNAVTWIVLSQDSIQFSHKGEPFTLKTLRNLIKQQSTKNKGENNVGQYGTGFMATHRFNTKVYIQGECKIKPEEYENELYFPLPEGFCLDRSPKEVGDFIKELDKELESIKTIVTGRGSKTPKYEWTSFKYELSSEKVEEVSNQLDTTTRLMPFVLVFNDRISECTIDNAVSHKSINYKKVDRQQRELAYNEGHRIVTTKIEVVENGVLREIVINSIETASGEDRVVIPPLPLGLDDVKKIPSQFLFFPLLGTENWGTNFIFHSSRLYPTEKRDSYHFPQDNDSLVEKYKNNEKVLDEMFEMLFDYYRHNVSEQRIPLDFAKVNFTYNGDDKITDEYYKNIQQKFSKEFVKWQMIPTEQGYMSIEGDVVVFDHDIYANVDRDIINSLIPVVIKLAGQLKTIPKENVVAWSEVVYGWDATNEGYYIRLEKICEGVKEKSDELLQFLLFLKALGTIGSDLMAKNALIPNRNGELKKTGELRDGKTITKELFEIASPIIGHNSDKIVDVDYSEIVQLNEYTRTDLRNEVNSAIQELRNKSVDFTAPKLLESLSSETTINQLIKYCSIFPNENSNSYRARLLPIICKLYNQDCVKTIIASIQSDESDLYRQAFDYLTENTMLMLSLKPTSWLTADEGWEHNRTSLLDFLNVFTDTEDKQRIEKNNEKLNKYGILPNQLGVLHIAKELQLNVDVDDELIQLYYDIFNKKLESFFVDVEFKDFYEFKKYTGKDVGREIEEELGRRKYTGNEIIRIICQLNKGIWKDIFPNIFARREELYYSHGSDEEKELLYRIQMQGSEKMERVADLMESEHFNEILLEAERIQSQLAEEKRQFQFTFAIGKLIEDKIREEVNDELRTTFGMGLSAEDRQYGQDIVIFYREKPMYYIECKAKWNFNEPAHMSSMQIKQAIHQKEKYALCCIDCTQTGCKVPPDANEEDVRNSAEDILTNTYVHMDIMESMEEIVGPIILHEDKNINEEDSIRVYSSLSCNIPKKVFVNGMKFHDFMKILIESLKSEV